MFKSEKISNACFKKRYPFILTIILSLLAIFPLKAGSTFQPETSLEQDLNDIERFDTSGLYIKALEKAYEIYNKGLESPSCPTSALYPLQKKIEELQSKVLCFGAQHHLFDENSKPTVRLLNLLHDLGMKFSQDSPPSREDVIDWTQEKLLRKEERWNPQTNQFEDMKEKLVVNLEELGFLKEVKPHFQTYEGAILHGATVGTVRIRLDYLINQWKERNVRFNKLYILTGERPLQSREIEMLTDDTSSNLKIRSDWKKPSELPSTERDMIEYVWDQADIPEEIRQNVKLYFATAPMKIDSKGNKIRPTTNDAISAWLNLSPPKGLYLPVSNSPYILRQGIAMQIVNAQEEGYQFDTIGPNIGESTTMALIVDEVARAIYQTSQKP